MAGRFEDWIFKSVFRVLVVNSLHFMKKFLVPACPG
jgi:hypothetical protein